MHTKIDYVVIVAKIDDAVIVAKIDDAVIVAEVKNFSPYLNLSIMLHVFTIQLYLILTISFVLLSYTSLVLQAF